MKIPKNFIFVNNLPDRAKIIGKTFNRLTCIQTIGYIQEKRKRTGYLFTCSCGNAHVTFPKDVKNGKVQSCGCLHNEMIAETGRKNKKELREILKRKERPNPSFTRYYKQYQYTAKRRGLEFSLDEETFKNLTSSKCHYCNSSPSKEYGYKWQGYSSSYICNGIDRKDNNIGYIKSNSLPCCAKCNHAKHTLDYREFIGLCIDVADNHK